MKKLSLVLIILISSVTVSNALELIRDPYFQNGITVYSPTLDENGRLQVEGALQFDASEDPIWTVGQWRIKRSIYGADSEVLPSGSTRWQNLYKAITIGPEASVDGDLIMTINSINEFDNVWKTTPGLCFVVNQQLRNDAGEISSPSLDELTEVNWSMNARLLYAENLRTEGYNSKIHEAGFKMNIIIMQKETNDRLYIGLPLYVDHDRWCTDTGIMHDEGSGKAMYRLNMRTYADGSLHSGKWVHVYKDVYQDLVDGLKAAWEEGYFEGTSHDLNDYYINAFQMAWEVTGLSVVSMQVSDISIDVN